MNTKKHFPFKCPMVIYPFKMMYIQSFQRGVEFFFYFLTAKSSFSSFEDSMEIFLSFIFDCFSK